MKQRQKGDLIGLYFHSFDGKDVQWQGVVIGSPAPGFYIVQLFEWFMGTDSSLKLVKIEQMLSWTFYGTDVEMRDARKKLSPPS